MKTALKAIGMALADLTVFLFMASLILAVVIGITSLFGETGKYLAIAGLFLAGFVMKAKDFYHELSFARYDKPKDDLIIV